MSIELFIDKLKEEFEEVKEPITPSTDFRQLDEWSSMYALIIIALIDVEYEVMVNGEDLSSVNTVQELFDLVKSRKK